MITNKNQFGSTIQIIHSPGTISLIANSTLSSQVVVDLTYDMAHQLITELQRAFPDRRKGERRGK